MTATRSALCTLVALAGCGGNDERQMSDAAIDASLGPPIVVQVSKDGNDAHDGVTSPVETLKRAIAIAAANPRVTDIVLAAGSYTMRDGEMFPYTVPAGVEITGPAGGGAILVGTGAETGLMFSSGQLQDLQLDSFLVAVEAAADVRLKSLRITNSKTAVHGGNAAKLRINDLDITGPAPGPNATCAIGISIDGAGDLMVTTLTTHNVGPAIQTVEAGTIDIAMATVTLPGFVCQRPSVEVLTTRGFSLSESKIDGGALGLNLVGHLSTGWVPATITNTTFTHLDEAMTAIGVMLQVNGAFITSNGRGLRARDGSYTLTSSLIGSSSGVAMTLQGSSAATPVTLTMRGTSVSTSGGDGVVVQDFATADLGTAASPGGNFLQSNGGIGLNILGPAGGTQISAVGNTWNASVQGADATGKYPVTDTITGPVAGSRGSNYAVADGWSLVR